MKGNARLLACMAVFALLIAACGGGTADTTAAGGSDTTAAGGAGTTAAGGAEGDITIGVAWNNFNEPRWANADKPAIQAVLEEAGATYIEADAGSSAEQQLTDVENLISQGADALIILAQDGTAILPAVQSALEQGIPVIGYDRLIEDPGVFYLTFDNVEVGRMQARAIYELVPEGNYVFIKGNQADANADFLFGGQMEVLTEATGCEELSDDCAIVNVGESYTDDWLPEVAQENMENFLTQNDNDVQAVVASNDGMAGGVVAALEAQGLAGEVPVSGQDGDFRRPQPGGTGHPVRFGVEERLRSGTDGRRDRPPAYRRDGPGRCDGSRRSGRLCPGRRVGCPTVHHSWRRGRGVHRPDPSADHPGEPERAHRCRVGLGRGSLSGSRGRQRRGLPVGAKEN